MRTWSEWKDRPKAAICVGSKGGQSVRPSLESRSSRGETQRPTQATTPSRNVHDGQDARDSKLLASPPGGALSAARRCTPDRGRAALAEDGELRKAGVLFFALPAGLAGLGTVRLWFEYGSSGYTVADLGTWPAESEPAPGLGQVCPAISGDLVFFQCLPAPAPVLDPGSLPQRLRPQLPHFRPCSFACSFLSLPGNLPSLAFLTQGQTFSRPIPLSELLLPRPYSFSDRPRAAAAELAPLPCPSLNGGFGALALSLFQCSAYILRPSPHPILRRPSHARQRRSARARRARRTTAT